VTFLAVIILEEEENDNLMVYRISKSAMGNFSKRMDGYYSSLIGRYFMDSGMKYREYFGVSKDIFQSIHFVI
jgi:hypothetical protein